MKQACIMFSVVSLFTATAWAGGPGTTSADFLKQGQGVRAVAMGESYAALGDGLDALSYNPAGLVQLATPTVNLMHSFWLQDIGTEYLSYGTPLGPLGTVAGGLTVLHTAPVDQTLEDANGNYAGTGGQVSAMDLGFVAAYSQKLNRLLPTNDPILKNVLIGASLRIVSEMIDTTNVFGGGVDLGAIWRQTEEITPQQVAPANGAENFSEVKPMVRDAGWRVGFAAQNLGGTTDELLPIDFRAGAGYVAQDLLTVNGRGTVAVDALIPIDNAVQISAGAEYAVVSPNTEFAVRVGYKAGNEVQDLGSSAGFTVGAGAAINAGLLKYEVDYAFVPYGDLGSTQRISLTIGFLPPENAARTTKSASFIGRENLPTSVVVPKAAAPAKATKPAAESTGNTGTALGLDLSPTAAAPLSDLDKIKRSLNVFMGRVKSGMLPPIAFDKDNALAAGSEKSLDKLGPILEHVNQGVVVITGYAGDAKSAQDRAKAASRYLTMNFRIEPDQIQTKAGDPANAPKNSSISVSVEAK